MKNPEKFKNIILVADRLYFSYKFMNFLIEHDIKFIIRARGHAINLTTKGNVKNNSIDYDIVQELKKKVRVIEYDDIIEQTIYPFKNKRRSNEIIIVKINNNCTIVTNLKILQCSIFFYKFLVYRHH